MRSLILSFPDIFHHGHSTLKFFALDMRSLVSSFSSHLFAPYMCSLITSFHGIFHHGFSSCWHFADYARIGPSNLQSKTSWHCLYTIGAWMRIQEKRQERYVVRCKVMWYLPWIKPVILQINCENCEIWKPWCDCFFIWWNVQSFHSISDERNSKLPYGHRCQYVHKVKVLQSYTIRIDVISINHFQRSNL